MRLHLPLQLRSALIAAVVTFAGFSAAYGADYEPEYDPEYNADVDIEWISGTKTITSSSDLEFPTAERGAVHKNDDGTLTITIGSDKGANSAEITNTASDYTGNVYIHAGALQLGDANGLSGENYRISPNVLGSSGTVYVEQNAAFNLHVTQNGTATFGKNISLNGGQLHILDGNYNFNGGLTLKADSTLINDWDKNHTFNGLDAGDKTLTMTQGNNKASTQTFNGVVKAKEIVVGNQMTVIFDAKNHSLTSYDVEKLSLGVNSTAKLHLTASGNGTGKLGDVTMANGAKLYSIDCNYNIESLNIADSANVVLENQWDKSFNVKTINAANATLTAKANDNPNAQSSQNAWVVIGDGSLGTLNIESGGAKVTSGNASIDVVNVSSGATLLAPTAWNSLNVGTINLVGGAKLRLDNGGNSSTVGRSDGFINVNATADNAAVIAGGISGETSIISQIAGKGLLELRRSEQGFQNNINVNGVISDGADGVLSIKHVSGQYTITKANTYTGGTIIAGSGAHSITLRGEGTLGTGAVTLENGHLKLNGVTFNNALSGEGTVTLSGSNIITLYQTIDEAITLDIAGGATATLKLANGALENLHTTTLGSSTFLDKNGNTATSGYGVNNHVVAHQDITSIATTITYGESSKTLLVEDGITYIAGETAGTVFAVNSGNTVNFGGENSDFNANTTGIDLYGGSLIVNEALGSSILGEDGDGFNVYENSSVTLNGADIKLDAANVHFDENKTLTLSGNGHYVSYGGSFNSSGSLAPNNIVLSDGWSGTLTLTGATFVGTDLDSFGGTTTLEIDGCSGYITTGSSTENVNIILKGDLTLNNGNGGDVHTFAGKIIGDGSIIRLGNKGTKQTYKFTNDISDWTGSLEHRNTEAAQVTYVEISGTTEINIDLLTTDNASLLTVTVDNTNNVALNGNIQGNIALKLTGNGTKTFGVDTKVSFSGPITITGGALDINGHGDLNNEITLNGGASLVNNGKSVHDNLLNIPNITLGADAYIGGTAEETCVIARGHANTSITLATHTLTKLDDGTYKFINPHFDSGNLVVSKGTVWFQERTASGSVDADEVKVTVNDGATFSITDGNSNGIEINQLNGAGNVQLGSNTLTVSGGDFTGIIKGTTGTLAVADNGELALTVDSTNHTDTVKHIDVGENAALTLSGNYAGLIGGATGSQLKVADSTSLTLTSSNADNAHSVASVSVGAGARLVLEEENTKLQDNTAVALVDGSFLFLNNSAVDNMLAITVDSTAENQAILAGGLETNLAGTINGKGELIITNIPSVSPLDGTEEASESAHFTLKSVISDADDGTLTVHISGAEGLIINAVNTYTGGTIVDGDSNVILNSASALGKGDVTVENNSTVHVNAENAINGDVTVNGGTLKLGVDKGIAGDINFQTGNVYAEVAGSADVLASGDLVTIGKDQVLYIDCAGALTKNLTVDGGTVYAQTSGGITSETVTVTSGGSVEAKAENSIGGTNLIINGGKVYVQHVVINEATGKFVKNHITTENITISNGGVLELNALGGVNSKTITINKGGKLDVNKTSTMADDTEIIISGGELDGWHKEEETSILTKAVINNHITLSEGGTVKGVFSMGGYVEGNFDVAMATESDVTNSAEPNKAVIDDSSILFSSVSIGTGKVLQVANGSMFMADTEATVTANISNYNTAVFNLSEGSTFDLSMLGENSLVLNLVGDLTFDCTTEEVEVNLFDYVGDDNEVNATSWRDIVTVVKNGQSLDHLWTDVIFSATDGTLTFTNLVVPEPATASLSLLGLAALMMRRRRVAK